MPELQRVAHHPTHSARRAFTRWLRRILLAAGLLGVVALLVYNWMPKPVVVDLATAQRGSLEVTVEEDGKTRVHDRFVVAAPISGNLARIELQVGDATTAGQVIAQIQPPDPALLDPRSRDEATARLAAAVAQQRTAQTTLARARAARDQSMRDAERTRKLATTGAVTATERERSDLSEQLAIADANAADQQLTAAVASVAAARAVLGQGTRSGAAFSIASPTNGRVFKVLRDSAGPVAAGTPLLELGDPHALEVVIDVLSSDAARITTGMPCVITAWGGDHDLAGTVTRIEPSAFTHISALGVEEQRVNIIVAIIDPPPAIGDGFRVEGKIILWAGETLTVPGSAVFRDKGAWAVYTVERGRAKLVHVEIGRRGRLDLEIVRGIEPGAQVILHPGDAITNGARVSAGDRR